MIYGAALFHIGVGVMCVAAVVAVLSGAVFFVTGKHLRKVLDEEYGPKRH